MSPTELADALGRIADHYDLAGFRVDPNQGVDDDEIVRSASHALRRLGRVEEAAGRALRVLELEFNECGECVGADVCTRCALSAALRAE